MTVDYSLIGKRLAELRRARGLTQEKLAEMTELTNNYISNIEHNRSIPSLETLLKLCHALQVTPDAVLLGAFTQAENYMTSELKQRIEGCTAKEKRLIDGFIGLLLKERE